jgi:valyl-tRNA synthetase
VRQRRMAGYDSLWLPGTDHASIATHTVIERELAKEGQSRRDLGREEFLRRAWSWKERYGDTIVNQLKRLGCSCDWTRLRFTMDPLLSRAVREAFVRYWEDGLLYRDTRMVTWCPRCRTALSDLEVRHEETDGMLWYIRYPGAGGGPGVVVATTRPETMLGDTAVAVNSKDERYKDVVGGAVVLPLVGREIPIVADEAVDPSFGTGAVKITPAHDADDYDVAQRHGLPTVVAIDEEGLMTDEVPAKYRGMTREKCREFRWPCATAARRWSSPTSRCSGSSSRPSSRSRRGTRSSAATWRSCRSVGSRSTSIGWTTSTTGASRGSCGGATASRRGIATTAAK